MNKLPKLALVSILSASACVSAFAVSLTDLTHGYDVFVNEDATTNSGHIHGAMLVGGDLNTTNSTFNTDNVTSPDPTLAIGGQLNMSGSNQAKRSISVGDTSNGLVIHDAGNTRLTYGGFDDVPNLHLDQNQSAASIATGLGFDVNAAFSELSSFSNSLGGIASTISHGGGSNLNFNFDGGSGLEVLSLTGAELNGMTNIGTSGNTGSGAHFVVNVDLSGFSDTLSGLNNNINGVAAGLIVWNFFGASELEISGSFGGSILAPELDLIHQNNELRGMVIANSFSHANGQVHVHQSTTDFPHEVPDAGGTALLLAMGLAVMIVGFRSRQK